MSRVKKLTQIFIKKGPLGTVKAFGEYGRKIKRNREFCNIARQIHLISPDERAKQIQTKFAHPVKFSIITPLYNTPKEYLIELLESMNRQTYSDWELCLADGSDEEHKYVKEICEEWIQKDSRIIYEQLEENRGISENTNRCIQLATGEYYGLLDHDDVLHESALYEMMKTIEETSADFLYSDEVKFSNKIEDAKDFNFKSSFGKDELRSHNYICHFTVFSKDLLKNEKELYRPSYDGSQDHDMVLRLTEKAKRIIHVPKVLYYWRVHPQSVSMNLDSKSYAVDAAIRAIGEQLKRSGENGVVKSNLPYRTIYRIKYDVQGNPKIIILIHGCYDSKNKVANTIKSNTEYLNYKIVFTDEKIKNFGKKINQAIQNNVADYYILLDGKCVPKNRTWIKELLMYAQRKDVCAVSPKIIYENDTICFAGMALDKHGMKIKRVAWKKDNKEQGYEAMLRYVRNITAVWRGCCMFSYNSWKTLHGFAENISGYEEIDFSLKGSQKKMWNVWTCFSELTYTQNEEIENEGMDIEAFVEKWDRHIAEGDKYYPPYLEKLGLL